MKSKLKKIFWPTVCILFVALGLFIVSLLPTPATASNEQGAVYETDRTKVTTFIDGAQRCYLAESKSYATRISLSCVRMF